MKIYLSFGFAWLFFVVGYLGTNNTTILSSNLTDASIIVSLETLFKDIYSRSNYYSYDRDHPSLDFYNIPLANAQEHKKGDDINNNNENENDKYVILVFDRGYKSTFTKAKPILDKYDFKSTIFVACSRTESPKGMNWDQLRLLQNKGHDIQSHGSDHAKLIDLKSYEEMESIVR